MIPDVLAKGRERIVVDLEVEEDAVSRENKNIVFNEGDCEVFYQR